MWRIFLTLLTVCVCKEAVHCEFHDTDSLLSCQHKLRENTQQLCPTRDWGYPGEPLSALTLHPSRKVDRRAWHRLHDDETQAAVTTILRDKEFNISPTDLLRFDYPLWSILLGVITLLLAWTFFLPITCCCPGRYRPRKPARAWVVFLLAAVAGLGIIILVSLGVKCIKTTGQIEQDIKCAAPGMTYSLSALELHDVFKNDSSVVLDPEYQVLIGEATFDNFGMLGLLLKALPGQIEYTINYVKKFDTLKLGTLTTLAPLATYMWTGPLLAEQRYLGWRDETGYPQTFKLSQMLLGFESIKQGGWLTGSASSSVLSPIYTVLNVLMGELHLDMSSIGDSLKSFLDVADAAEAGYNDFLSQWSDVTNSDTIEKVSNAEYYKHIKGTLFGITVIPICFLALTFFVFKYWVDTFDLATGTPRMGCTMKSYVVFLTSFFILYASLLFIFGGIGLLAMKMLNGGCEYLQEVLESRSTGLFPIDDQYMEVCVVNQGTGDVAEIWGFSDALKQLDQLLRAPSTYGLSRTSFINVPGDMVEVMTDPDSSLVIPKFESDSPWLSNTTLRVWRAGLQTSNVKFDCDREDARVAMTYHCKAFADENSLAKSKNVMWYKELEEENTNTVYGVTEMTTAMDEMMAGTKCYPTYMCIRNVPACKWKSPWIIVDSFQFSYIEPDWLKDVDKNWDTIKSKVPQSDRAKTLFDCIEQTTRKTEWVVALRLAILKSLTMSTLYRDPSVRQDDQTMTFPGWFDITGVGRRLPIFYILEDANELARLVLTDYDQFRKWAPRNSYAALQMLEQASIPSLTKILSIAATRLNPIFLLARVISSFKLQFNCQALGAMTRGFKELLCEQTGPSLSNLFIVWSLLGYWHLLVFGMLLHFGLFRFSHS